MNDDLDRFLVAQEGVFAGAEAEIAAGKKQGHWMWFIFPQLRGLGRSEMAHRFGIADLDEAVDYLMEPVLGPRLIRMHDVLRDHEGTDPETIFGPVDAAKLRSSATLFAACPGAPPMFQRTLDLFFDGQPCRTTLESLGQ